MKKHLLTALSFLSIVFAAMGISSCSSKVWDTIYVDGYGLYYNGGNTYTIVELPEDVLALREWTIPEKIGKYKISGLGEEWHKTYLMGTNYWDALSDLGNIRKLNVPESVKKIRADNLETVAVFETEGVVSKIEINGKQHEENVWFLSPQEEGVEYKYLTQENIVGDQVYITEGDEATFLFSLGEGDCVMEAEYKGLPVTKIGSYAFSYGNYADITLGENVNKIEENAFYDSSLDTVNFSDKLTAIDAYAFTGVTAKSINLPEGILTIEEGAFSCSVIESISLPQSITTIGKSVFKEIQLSCVVIPNQVTEISADTFYGSVMDEIIIPNSVTSIGSYAFYGAKVKEIKIPNGVTVIEEGTFAKTVVESVTLPNALEKIGEAAFERSTLKEIEIPETVIRIEEDAFSLSGLTSVKLPTSLEYLGDAVFDGGSLENIDLSEYMLTYIPERTFRSCPLTGEVILPDCIKSIGWDAFRNAQFTSFRFPASLETIETGAFCNVQLEKIGLPDTIQTLGSASGGYNGNPLVGGAFENNLALTEFVLPDSCLSFNMTALHGCLNLKKLHLGNADISRTNEFPNLEEITVSETNEKLSVKDGVLYGVENIYLGTFVSEKYRSQYESMLENGYTDEYLRRTLPYSLLFFEAVYEDVPKIIMCPAKLNVKQLMISDAILDENVFSGNTYLEEITLNLKNSEIPDHAFDGCTALRKVTLSDNITKIDQYAFYKCPNLTEINLSNVKEFNTSAFEYCSSLKEADFTSATKIGVSAFSFCDLREVHTYHVEVISVSAFSSNKNLEKVTLEECHTLQAAAFYGCEKLTEFNFSGGEIQHNVFLGTPLDENGNYTGSDDEISFWEYLLKIIFWWL